MDNKQLQSPTLESVEKHESKWLDRVIVAAAVIIVIAALAIFFGKKSGRSNAVQTLQQLEQAEPDYSFLIDNIEGSYDIRLSNASESLSGVARIKCNDIEGYDLIVYSEYSPITYHFKYVEGVRLVSDRLGEGQIGYEKDFEKITITFKKEDSRCELTR